MSTQKYLDRAIAEYDRLGRKGFYDRYPDFVPSISNFIIHRRRRYPAKPIVALAHRLEHGGRLRTHDFNTSETYVVIGPFEPAYKVVSINPNRWGAATKAARKRGAGFIGKRIDWEAKNAMDAEVGHAGEAFVLAQERKALAASKWAKHAKAVRHVAQEDGDGLGYDIGSYSASDGKKVYIEVKSTTVATRQEFFVTEAERRRSLKEKGRYLIYRVLVSKGGKGKKILEKIRGPIQDAFDLAPKTYLAKPKARRRRN